MARLEWQEFPACYFDAADYKVRLKEVDGNMRWIAMFPDGNDEMHTTLEGAKDACQGHERRASKVARAEFEAWASKSGIDLTSSEDGDYAWIHASLAWGAWQASRKAGG